MPKFEMPLGGKEILFSKLPAFVRGYIEAAFFTDSGSDDDGTMKDATFADMPPTVVALAVYDCEEFQDANSEALAVYLQTMNEEHAGHDFWLSRNGHGSGFFDRTDKVPREICDKLQEACRATRETGLYRGDDGRVYFL